MHLSFVEAHRKEGLKIIVRNNNTHKHTHANLQETVSQEDNYIYIIHAPTMSLEASGTVLAIINFSAQGRGLIIS